MTSPLNLCKFHEDIKRAKKKIKKKGCNPMVV